jgi:anti-sigma regulatory factor (Ser/Thr protein kinase)
MTASPWAHRAPPVRDTQSARVGRWTPGTLAELTVSRHALSAALHDGARPSAAAEGAVQRLLLAFEELTSNALRHGRLPVEVTVTKTGRSWLLEVSDAAGDDAPTPAADRDPALGGLGLPLVARISAAHGWTVTAGRKVVWASVDFTRPEASDAPRDPRPRAGRGPAR